MYPGLGIVQRRCLAILGETTDGPLDTAEIARRGEGRKSVRQEKRHTYRHALRSLVRRGMVVNLVRCAPPCDDRPRWATAQKAATYPGFTKLDRTTRVTTTEDVVRQLTGRRFGHHQLRILLNASPADGQGQIVLPKEEPSTLEAIRRAALHLWHDGLILIDRDGVSHQAFDAQSSPPGLIHFRLAWLSPAGEALAARIRTALEAVERASSTARAA